MKIGSILENQKLEKELQLLQIAKKYMSLGFEISLSEKLWSPSGYS